MPTKNDTAIVALMSLYSSRVSTGNNDVNGNALYTITGTVEEIQMLQIAASIIRDQDILITLLDITVPSILR